MRRKTTSAGEKESNAVRNSSESINYSRMLFLRGRKLARKNQCCWRPIDDNNENEVQSNRNAQGRRKKADNFRGKFVAFSACSTPTLSS